ncbi:YIP1 family protein [Haloarchaeobius iranensis]|uniref:Yip1 domain-containing protein n=1 Tax=Haloarchaeobius iranensis TaxID=996166 RepID=A0A1G9XYV9_9EURY|nr:YIP1 family protein [Haloarchaeobius iranensis]SDN02032.1 Yip1 domain-containing protein [Haloarchaeobius iranensis]
MAALHPIRQFLVEPRAFFEEHGTASTLPVAALAVVGLAIALAVGVTVMSGMLAGAVQGTVMVDNPDRPPQGICGAFENDSPVTEGCDEPAEIERDAGAIVREAANEFVGTVVLAPFLLWLAGGLTVYLGGLLVGGDTSLPGSFSVAGWAAVPEFARLVAGLAILQFALADVTITNLESAPAAVRAAIAPVEPLVALASLLTAAWQLSILSAGLAVEADISRGAAAVVTGIPLGLLVLATLV